MFLPRHRGGPEMKNCVQISPFVTSDESMFFTAMAFFLFSKTVGEYHGLE